MRMRFIAGITLAALLLPFSTYAAPFGGPIGQIIFCYNEAIWTTVGPPVGGIYIWTPSTQTYPFGPPAHSGQYLLGLYGAPYYCLVSIVPIIVYPGISITMMGSSQ
jgi:hypothetical protein